MARNKVAPLEDGAKVQNFEGSSPRPSTASREPCPSPDSRGPSESQSTKVSQPEFQGCWTVVVVSILFIINLLNYMDRYTIAGLLDVSASFKP